MAAAARLPPSPQVAPLTTVGDGLPPVDAISYLKGAIRLAPAAPSRASRRRPSTSASASSSSSASSAPSAAAPRGQGDEEGKPPRGRITRKSSGVSGAVYASGRGAVGVGRLGVRGSDGGDGDGGDAAFALEPEPDEGNMEYKLQLLDCTPVRLQHLITQMNYRLKEGHGEAVYRVGVEDDGTPTGLPPDDLRTTIHTVYKMAQSLSCHVLITQYCAGSGRPGWVWAQLHVRKRLADYTNIRVAVMGDAASGKSTMIGVVTQSELDDGNGRARLSVLRHRHEIENGTTSSVSRQLLGFDSFGAVSGGGSPESVDPEQLLSSSAKLLTLIDLAGDERFFGTTLSGMTGTLPDYAVVVVAADRGVLRMTKQHLGVALALNVPLAVVVTKIDLISDEQLGELLASLDELLRSDNVGRLPIVAREEEPETVADCAQNLHHKLIVPIFCVSNVTGEGLDAFKQFLNLLPKHKNWAKHYKRPAYFAIDERFKVAGVGTVVHGVMMRGCLQVGEQLMLGPYSTEDDLSSKFRSVKVKSIHIHKQPAQELYAGQTASIALAKARRSALRKGMVLVHPSRHPRGVVAFDASVLVLKHDSSLRVGYEPVVHVGTVEQSVVVRRILPPTNITDRRKLQQHLEREDLRAVAASAPLPENGNDDDGDDELLNPRPDSSRHEKQRARRRRKQAKRARRRRSVSTRSSSRVSKRASAAAPNESPPPSPTLGLGLSAKAQEPREQRRRSLPSFMGDASSSSDSDGDSAHLDELCTGDRGIVHFTFRHRAEFLLVGSKLIFREARTRGIGRVLKLYYG